MYPSFDHIIDSLGALFDVPSRPEHQPFESRDGVWIVDSFHVPTSPPSFPAEYLAILEELDGGDEIYDLDEVRADSGSIKRDGQEVARFSIFVPIVAGGGEPEYGDEDVLAYQVETVVS